MIRILHVFSICILGTVLLFSAGCISESLAEEHASFPDGPVQAAPESTEEQQLQLMSGTPYANTAYVYTSTVPGPAVLVVGGVHGNEPAGSLAARKLCSLSLRRGTLIVVPEANRVALQANVRTLPEIEDINRAYPGKAEGTPAEQIAFSIVQLMDKYHVSMVVDIHEGYAFNAVDPKSVGETILPGMDDMSTLLAMEAVEEVNQQITDKKKKFSVLANPIAGSTAYYANMVLNIPAFTVETSMQQPLEDRIGYSVCITTFLIRNQGLLD